VIGKRPAAAMTAPKPKKARAGSAASAETQDRVDGSWLFFNKKQGGTYESTHFPQWTVFYIYPFVGCALYALPPCFEPNPSTPQGEAKTDEEHILWHCLVALQALVDWRADDAAWKARVGGLWLVFNKKQGGDIVQILPSPPGVYLLSLFGLCFPLRFGTNPSAPKADQSGTTEPCNTVWEMAQDILDVVEAEE